MVGGDPGQAERILLLKVEGPRSGGSDVRKQGVRVETGRGANLVEGQRLMHLEKSPELNDSETAANHAGRAIHQCNVTQINRTG